MGSNTVVKTVGKQLKYYFDVKRLEDGFDLSSKKASEFNHPSSRARPSVHHEGLHDRALKHYFRQPEVRAKLTRLEPVDSEEEHSPRERQIRKSLTRTMKKYQFGKAHVPEWYYVYTLGGPRQQPHASDTRVTSGKTKKTRPVTGGWPVLRNVPEPDVPPDEAERLINNASKILVNSGTANNRSRGQHRAKSAIQRYPLRPVETDWELVHRLDPAWSCCEQPPCVKRPRAEHSTRPVTAANTWDIYGQRLPSAKVKAHDDSHVDKASRRSYLRRPQSSPRPSQQKTVKTSGESPAPSHDSSSSLPASRPKGSSPRQQQGSVVSIPTEQSDDEGVEEVTEGRLAQYEVTVKTGNCIGASTTAAVYLTLYGEKGRTPALHLETSQWNKNKFQRGKEDLFVLKTPHVGQMTKVKIGHDRPELSYAWYLETLSVRDLEGNQVFQIPCHRWLSGQDEDRHTYCAFLLNPHKDTEKLDTSTASNDKTSPRETSDTKPRPVSVSKHSDPSRHHPQTAKASRTTGRTVWQAARPRTQNKGREVRGKTVVGAEVAGKGKNFKPTATSDDERGKDRKPRPVDEEYLAGYKAGLEAIEASERQKREEERMKNRQLLSGPSIHDACHRGDMERVQVLLTTFPEMKDSTDENGWTPLHIAASSGEVDLIKRLTSAGCDDLDVETPTGYTPTHLAAMNGHSAAIKILNAMGASVDCRTVDRQTPLHLASSAGHLECVKCLVANGADVTVEDTFSRTPLDLAEQYGQDSVTDFLQHCQDDLANPSSTFALMHQSQNKGASQTAAAATKSHDKTTSPHEGTEGTRPKTSTQRKREKEEQDLQVKREQYEEQHRHMQEEGVSFLDLIRQEMDDEA